MTAQGRRLITEEDLDQLEAFLLSDQVSDETLDLIGAHGFLFALCIGPGVVADQEWLEQLFDTEPQWETPEQKQHIESLLLNLKYTISHDLANDQEILLPCELTLEVLDDEEDTTDLTIWSQGFMEGVFMREEDWFSNSEDEVAGLLLPIMVASDLFEDTEILDVRGDRALCEEMAEQIPEVLVDLYLQFHAPD